MSASETPFDWTADNKDVIVPEQRSLAIYQNHFGQAVLRMERYWDEDVDTCIAIDCAQIPRIIAALKAIAEAPAADQERSCK
jgi:hypothetical protein